MKNSYFIKNLNSSNRYQNIKNYLLTNNLLDALKNKNILVSGMSFSKKEKNKKIQLALFYRTQKLKDYKSKNLLKLKKIKNLIKVNKLFNEDNITLRIINLNLFIKEKDVIHLFEKIKNYSNKLFQKRTNLFCDLIKIMTLSSSKKISVWGVIYLLSLVFKPLQKKKHGLFVSFVNEIFTYLISQKSSSIIGVKLIIAGRLRGKPRANVAKFSIGKMPLTREKSNIKAAQTHIYTIYGCFGLKLWINYKN